MTDYISITEAQTDPGAPFTSDLAKQYRDNPIAIAEGSTGAPVMLNGGWLPYNMVTFGDGANGLIYDFSVNGSVSSVESPVFTAGLEYALYVSDMKFSAPSNALIDLYKSTGASYENIFTSASTHSNLGFDLFGEVMFPSVTSKLHYANIVIGGGSGSEAKTGYFYISTAQTVSKVRVKPASGNINSGKVYLYRRGGL